MKCNSMVHMELIGGGGVYSPIGQITTNHICISTTVVIGKVRNNLPSINHQ